MTRREYNKLWMRKKRGGISRCEYRRRCNPRRYVAKRWREIVEKYLGRV